MGIDKLQTVIQSFLDKTGFTEYEREIKKSRSITSQFSEFAGSSLGKLATGYFTVTGLASQYSKAIEASNYQLEQETKLQATMTGQGFRQEQIDSIKEYSKVLQSMGVVAEDVTLAGTQQLATYNLTEENIKKLMPAMQDILVQQKGLAGTGGDAINAANMLAKGLLGQTGMLEKAGINLNDYQRKLISTGTQEQKVAALVEAVTMNVGEQNKEFLKTPEGKIQSAHNRIASTYADIGALFRNTRADFWDTMAESLEFLKPYITTGVKGAVSGIDTFKKALKGIFKTFEDMPPEVKTTIKILGGFLAIKKFPVAGAVLVVEDIIGAFQGKESVIEPVYDQFMKVVGLNSDFQELRQTINQFWSDFDVATKNDELTKFTATIEVFSRLMRSLRGVFGVFGGVAEGIFDTGRGLITGDFDYSGALGTLDRAADDLNIWGDMGDITEKIHKFKDRKELENFINYSEGEEFKTFSNVYNNKFGMPELKWFNDTGINQKELDPFIPTKANEKELELKDFKSGDTLNNNTSNSSFSPVIKNNFNVTISGQATKEDLKDLENVVNNAVKKGIEQEVTNWKVQAGGNFGG